MRYNGKKIILRAAREGVTMKLPAGVFKKIKGIIEFTLLHV
jgi:hypothetical protein